MQDTWLSKKADKIQLYAHCKDMEKLLPCTEDCLWSNHIRIISPQAEWNTQIADKEKILECLAEHFHSVLSQPSVLNDEGITDLPEVSISNSLAELYSQDEVEKAVRRMYNGKAMGSNSIPAEVYAAGGPLPI